MHGGDFATFIDDADFMVVTDLASDITQHGGFATIWRGDYEGICGDFGIDYSICCTDDFFGDSNIYARDVGDIRDGALLEDGSPADADTVAALDGEEAVSNFFEEGINGAFAHELKGFLDICVGDGVLSDNVAAEGGF